jgi:hypothetical protein
MPLTAVISGTVTVSDFKAIHIERLPDGSLVGSVTVPIDLAGVVQQRTYEWTLTQAQKDALAADFVDSALQAARDGAGV